MSHTDNDSIDPKIHNANIEAAAAGPNLKMIVDDFRYDTEGYVGQARSIVRKYEEDKISNRNDIPYFEVYVVWFCKTLKNWKALVSTTLPDQKYYEITYNGDTMETYLDVYIKLENIAIPAL